MTEARKIIFSGHVQGVGFRQATKTVARKFPVTGFVRNLVDGTVECLVEGNREDIDAFLSALQTKMGSYISHVRAEVSASLGLTDFDIRR
jgi:acylphosphatase